jgi:hypothetical protein
MKDDYGKAFDANGKLDNSIATDTIAHMLNRLK